MEEEIWKTIPISLKYEASTFGRIRRIKSGRILKSYGVGPGYLAVSIKGTNGESITDRVHRLVAITFIPNPENKPTVNHIDHEPSNSHVSNLEWATYQEQIEHARKRKLTTEETAFTDIWGVRDIWKCDPETGERLEMFSTIREAAASSHQKKSMSEIYTVAEDHEIRSSIETIYPCIKTAIGFSWEFDKLRTIKSEEWKDIDPVHVHGSTGYKISTLGRILTKRNKVKSPYGPDYPCHSIRKKQYFSHRLVSLTFIPIVDGKDLVNHIDGYVYNPSVDNLEFCSNSENIQHAHENGLIKQETKKVWQYDLNGNFIKEFNSVKEAKDELGYRNISKAISKDCALYGFLWRRPSDDKSKIVVKRRKIRIRKTKVVIKRKIKKVWQYDLKGNFIKEFNSSKEVKDELGTNIRVAIAKGGYAGGFIWRRPSDDKIKVVKQKIREIKKVWQYDLNGNFIKEFNSVKEAKDELGKGNIKDAILKGGSAGGFIWRRPSDDKSKVVVKRRKIQTQKVWQYDLKGNFIKEFNSVKEAKDELGSGNIQKAILKEGSAGGFLWRRPSDDKSKVVKRKKRKTPKVWQYDIKGNFIKEFISTKEAMDELGVCDSSIRSSISQGSSAGGFIWRRPS